MKYLTSICIVLILLITLVSTSFINSDQVKAADNTINLGYVNWAGTEAETFVMRTILQKKMGFDVETTMVGVGPVYAALAQGDVDAFLGVWLPITHQDYINKYQNDIIKSGANFFGARIGLVVPEYVDIDSVQELNQHQDKFEGKIIGIDPGAGIMKASREAINHYNLDFELITSSGPAMVGTLKDAIDNQEWVVVTGWKPHYKFARFDLKFLEDPDKIYGATENVYSFHHPDLAQKHPSVVNLLHDFRMNSQQLGEVMGWIADGMDRKKAGEKWVTENEEIVESWINPAQVSE